MKIAKKILKIGGVLVLLIILAMVTIPYFFKDTIKKKAVELVNENINATASLGDVSISLFKKFPRVDVSLTDFHIVNKEPFVGDTLFSAKAMSVAVSLSDLLSGKYTILGLDLKDASVLIHLNQEGKGNFDIALPSEPTSQETTESAPLSLGIDSYSVENLKFTFKNDDGAMLLLLDEIYHTGKGNFADEVLDLDTKTTAKVSFSMDNSQFMSKIPIALDAVLGVDLKQQKYTFKENKALVNRLELIFDGFIQLLDEGQKYDLTFSAPSSSFQSFLALVPEEYSKSIENVKTTGNFTFNGKVQGEMVGDKIPTFAVEMFSENASVKYPDLPKTIRNINIDLKVNNQTGLMNDTQVNLNKFTMTIDEDNFSARAKVSNVVENPFVDADFKGVVNLANVSQAYPVSLDKKLTGIFKSDVSLQLDMNSVEKQLYQNIQAKGNASLQQFVYEGEEFVKPFHIDEATLNFSPSHIELSKFASKTGDSDLSLNGRLDNLFGFLFKKEVLKGNFNLNANKLVVSDFMQPATSTTSETTSTPETSSSPANAESTLKIPSFLDCTLLATAQTVIYDNLQLKNVSGKMIVKDEKLRLENLKTDIFGGGIAFNGEVSTKEQVPSFDMSLAMDKLNIPDAFTQITMLEKIAPIAKVVQGKINTKINVNGNLTNDLTPDMSTLSGDIVASLVDSKVKSEESALLSSLASNFQNLNLSNLNLKDVKVNAKFKDGKVNLTPFTLRYKDVAIDVAGTHGFDQTMDYKMVFNVPAQMLGNEAGELLSKLTAGNQAKTTNIPVTALVGGTFTTPKVSTDMKQVVADLTTQIAKSQIANLKDKGTDALKGLLSSKTDSATAGKAKQLVEGLTTKKDSTVNKLKEDAKEKAKQEAKKQIGGFLKGVLGGEKE